MTDSDRELLNKINNKLSFLISDLEKRKDLKLSVTAEDLNELQKEVSILKEVHKNNDEMIEKENDDINNDILAALSKENIIQFITEFDNSEEHIKLAKENKAAIKEVLEEHSCFNIQLKKAVYDEE
jgi:hypothetical protein